MRIYKDQDDDINKELKDTINKMLEINDIVLHNPPNDKIFKRYQFNYTIELFNIMTAITGESKKNYSDEEIKASINRLHDKIFKNRRY